MQGLDWGALYGEHHQKEYDPGKISAEVRKLYGDPYVKNRKGIYEYILGGLVDTKLLEVRYFDDATRKSVYTDQITKAELDGKSNCSYCAIGHDANRNRIWQLSDMDADHVSAWSKGGKTSSENCELLCKPHNRAKGNR
jgi:5-methylcytosine-specific restriction endonuclease McrA